MMSHHEATFPRRPHFRSKKLNACQVTQIASCQHQAIFLDEKCSVRFSTFMRRSRPWTLFKGAVTSKEPHTRGAITRRCVHGLKVFCHLPNPHWPLKLVQRGCL